MPDQIFENPRLVAIYDDLDGKRRDLDHYLVIAKELKARSILDIGSGTGCFACLASKNGFEVTALEPAQGSLDLARRKPNAKEVRWILGDATSLPAMAVDLAIMTGNVAQVFVTDQSWEASLAAVRESLLPNGHFVFEVRDPAQKAWLEWTRDKSYVRKDILGVGIVEGWCEVTDVSTEFLSFRWTYVFGSDGQIITSDSTLRFRDRETIENSLKKSGYELREVRDAPDRPQKEFVFIAALA
jgi:SAM-dependent methyltransferase